MGRTTDLATRARVRTPGKHIVLFAAAAVVVVAAAVNILKASPDNVFRPVVRAGVADSVMTFEPFLVDLAPDRAGRIGHSKLAIVIEPVSAEQAAAIDAARAQIAERVVFMLRTMTPEDFAGSEGMARVKQELKRRVDLVIAPEEVRDVVVSDIVIQ